MRFSLVLALVLAGLTMTASAQKYQKPKAKPAHSGERQTKSQPRAVKAPPSHSAAAQELHRVEQSSARVSASRKTNSDKAARTGPMLKGQKKEANPPIRVSAAGSSGHEGKGKQGNSSKSRLRHKGSHH